MQRFRRLTFTALLTCLHAFVFIHTASAQSERLELDWIFSEEGKAALALPRSQWLANGRIVTYEQSLPKLERRLEAIDPDNGRRRLLTDSNEARAALEEILKPDEPLEELGWPAEFGPNGNWAVYDNDDNIVLLNLGAETAHAVSVGDAKSSAPRFSPDGKQLAFVRNNDLYVWDIAAETEKRLTFDGTDTLLNGKLSWVYWEELLNRADRGYSWSPDSTAIAYLQSDESGVGEMHYVDFEPHLPRVIKQRHPKPGEANPRVRAGIVDVDSATTTWVELGSTPYEYLVRTQWLPDSQRVAIQTLNRAQTRLDIFLAARDDGEVRHLLRETNDGWVNVHDDLHFLGGDTGFIWRSERDGYSHLYRFDMHGQLVNQITEGEWALRPSGGVPGMDSAISYVDEQDEAIYFTALEKASTERHLYRIRFDGSDMRRLSDEDGEHKIYFAASGRHYLDRSSALNRPPSLSIHNADGTAVRTLADVGTEISDRFDLQDWELFSIDARDGFEMPAMMLKPRFFEPERKYPVLTYVYGGPSAPTVVNAWQRRARSLYHQLMADDGAIIFYVDNRSAAGKSKTDANTIVKQLYGPIEMNDLLDGIAWLKSQPWVDTERVGVWGWSGGGTMTLQSLTSSTEFAAGAAVAPVADWHYYDTIYTERYMKRPRDNPDGYEQTSHVQRAADLHGRLLLVHGTYDDNVHPQNTWAFSDGLIEEGITFDMMVYPMRKHGISDDAAQLHLFRTMREFWQRNLSLGD